MRTVITYGTFDIFHLGHLRLLERARSLGDRLVVGISTDKFNEAKGKKSIFSYEERAQILASIRHVDEVFPESDWGQKRQDIAHFNASVFVMGDDWKGKFDDLSGLAEVVYLPRTPSISTTEVKKSLRALSSKQIDELKGVLGALSAIVQDLD